MAIEVGYAKEWLQTYRRQEMEDALNQMRDAADTDEKKEVLSEIEKGVYADAVVAYDDNNCDMGWARRRYNAVPAWADVEKTRNRDSHMVNNIISNMVYTAREGAWSTKTSPEYASAFLDKCLERMVSENHTGSVADQRFYRAQATFLWMVDDLVDEANAVDAFGSGKGFSVDRFLVAMDAKWLANKEICTHSEDAVSRYGASDEADKIFYAWIHEQAYAMLEILSATKAYAEDSVYKEAFAASACDAHDVDSAKDLLNKYFETSMPGPDARKRMIAAYDVMQLYEDHTSEQIQAMVEKD